MNDNFYRAFEERYRGSRSVIKTRLEVYGPFIAPLLRIYQDAHALDLGCGRGEWLELLSECGFHPLGVDQDSGMLAACDELMLNVEQGDAIAYLRALPNESQVIISAFHFVEHIPFDVLRVLASEAMRVLKPGGLLIMETPNPENLVVATRNFYLDPTHERPIPTQLLAFVAEHAGFDRVKTLGLQESKDLVYKSEINLADVFHGASPDYAVIAQKHADSDVLALFEDVFEQRYGLGQDELFERWDARMNDRIQSIEACATQAEDRAQEAASRATQAEARVQEAASRATQAEVTAQMVCGSRSWRWTLPLRKAGKAARWFRDGSIAWITFSPSSRPRRMLKKFLLMSKQYVTSRPQLKCRILDILNHFPTLKGRLKKIGSTDLSFHTSWSYVDGPQHLSPRAKQIYADLKAAIERHRKENA